MSGVLPLPLSYNNFMSRRNSRTQSSAPWPNQTSSPVSITNNNYYPASASSTPSPARNTPPESFVLWSNQSPAPWPNESSPVSITNNNYYPTCSHASAWNAPPPAWNTPPESFALWSNQSPGSWPNQTSSPVSIMNNNYYPACSHASPSSAPPPAWNTPPVTAPPAILLLHPMLCSTPSAYPHLSWSIGRLVSTARICTQANTECALSNDELTTQAIHPSISEIRIHINALRQWQEYWGPIVVRRYSTSQGIRNEDVLGGIFNYFQTPLTDFEFGRLYHQDLVRWQAERRARELQNGGVSSDVERRRGLLRIDLITAAVGWVKFAGMQPVGEWIMGNFLLNLNYD